MSPGMMIMCCIRENVILGVHHYNAEHNCDTREEMGLMEDDYPQRMLDFKLRVERNSVAISQHYCIQPMTMKKKKKNVTSV